MRKIMIVVGEASGDAHATKLVAKLRELYDDVEFFGATGVRMREQGVETIVEADEFGIVGIMEVAKAVPMFLRVKKELRNAALERKPDVVILVDFPEFNLKLAKTLKKNDLRVVYFISPQLWAWRKYRISGISNYVDLLLTILPFEKDWYAEQGINHVKYVGNPLAGEVKPSLSKEEFCELIEIDPNKPIVTLLPGSRQKELERILPVLLEATTILEERIAGIQFVIPLAPNRKVGEVLEGIEDQRASGKPAASQIKIVLDKTYDSLAASDAAAVTSGTATLETALIGTPFAMIYRASSLNWHLLSPLISSEFFSLVNLISREETVKELVQDDLTPKKLADELVRLLDSEANSSMRAELFKIRELVGEKGASERAAEAVYNLIEGH